MYEIDEILEHVERYLGPLSSGVQPPEGLQGVQVLVFRDVPGLPDVEVYLTLGFSRHPELRQEFLVASYEREKPPWAGILFDLVDERRRKNAFFERGEAVGPRGPVVGGATAQGFIAFDPLFLPDGRSEASRSRVACGDAGERSRERPLGELLPSRTNGCSLNPS